MFYINRTDAKTNEKITVSECEDKDKAKLELLEYTVSERPEMCTYTMSIRPCENWIEG